MGWPKVISLWTSLDQTIGTKNRILCQNELSFGWCMEPPFWRPIKITFCTAKKETLWLYVVSFLTPLIAYRHSWVVYWATSGCSLFVYRFDTLTAKRVSIWPTSNRNLSGFLVGRLKTYPKNPINLYLFVIEVSFRYPQKSVASLQLKSIPSVPCL